MQDDYFGFDEEQTFDAGGFEFNENADYEKESYGSYAYKRVQKLRKKGRRRGINVPKLGFELTKPEKPRLAFLIAAIIACVFFAGIVACIFVLYNELITSFSDLSGIGDFLKIVFDPDILAASFGWSAIPGILLVAVYILIALLFVLPFFAAVAFLFLVRDIFFMAKCSKEEFAKGGIISSRITEFIVILVCAVLIFAVLLYYSPAGGMLPLWLIFIGFALILGGLLALMIAEKIKCGKWFNELDEYKRQNYLEHENALRSVKRRMDAERNFWSNLGK